MPQNGTDKKCRLVLDANTDSEKTLFGFFSDETISALKRGGAAKSEDFQFELYTTPNCQWNHMQGEESNRLTIWFGELLVSVSKIDTI